MALAAALGAALASAFFSRFLRLGDGTWCACEAPAEVD